MPRTRLQKILDFATFPVRALLLFGGDRWGLSSLSTERFDYAASRVRGYCLDVGCGRHNRFVTEHLGGHGEGIDVYAYEGLSEKQVFPDLSTFPFPDATFETVTFLANINHIPESLRDVELGEAVRVLKPGGVVIVTMGNPVAEILVHKIVEFYDRVLGTNYDMDSERGMHEEEEYYLSDDEITSRMTRAGVRDIRKHFFLTQWGLNHMFVGTKPDPR